MKKLISILFCVALMSSCTSTKQARKEHRAQKQLSKALSNDKIGTLRTLRNIAPCVTTGITFDSTKYKQWLSANGYLFEAPQYEPPVEPITDTFINTWEDSTKILYWQNKYNKAATKLSTALDANKGLVDKIWQLQKALKNVPPIDTKEKIKDSADGIICDAEKKALNGKLTIAESDRERYKKQRNTSYIINLILAAALGILLYLKFRK